MIEILQLVETYKKDLHMGTSQPGVLQDWSSLVSAWCGSEGWNTDQNTFSPSAGPVILGLGSSWLLHNQQYLPGQHRLVP